MLLALAAALPAQAPLSPAKPVTPARPNDVILRIGGREITAGEYDLLVNSVLSPDQKEFALGPGRRNFAGRLIELTVLATEAERINLDKRPDVVTQLEVQRENMLSLVLLRKLQQTIAVPEADIQAYYNAHLADYETITARHILIRVKDSPTPATAGKPELSDSEALAKAQTIRKRVVAGEDFAKIAKTESDDSAEDGGELGELRHGMNVVPFEEAAFALKPGDISEPVRTPFGYHLIQVHTHAPKPMADVKDDILTQLKPELARKALEDIVSKTKYDLNEAFFGPAPAGGN